MGLPAHASLEVPEDPPTFIAVGGGKGGVGKSIISSNLSAKLAQMGFRVLLIDLDLGGANLHTHYGLGMPKFCLADYVIDGQISFRDLFLKTSIDGVDLVAGGKDESWADTIDFTSGVFSNLWHELLNAKRENGFDFVVMDLGAGIHRHTIDFFTAAHLGIVTVLPEPTSIENAYTFLKATLWRLVDNVGMSLNACAFADEIKQSLFQSHESARSYLEKIKTFEKIDPELVHNILHAITGRSIGFVVNQVRSQKDVEISTSMQMISRTYFGFESVGLGFLNYDEAAWKALRNRRLLLLDFPHSILVKKMGELTARILQQLGY